MSLIQLVDVNMSPVWINPDNVFLVAPAAPGQVTGCTVMSPQGIGIPILTNQADTVARLNEGSGALLTASIGDVKWPASGIVLPSDNGVEAGNE